MRISHGKWICLNASNRTAPPILCVLESKSIRMCEQRQRANIGDEFGESGGQCFHRFILFIKPEVAARDCGDA